MSQPSARQLVIEIFLVIQWIGGRGIYKSPKKLSVHVNTSNFPALYITVQLSNRTIQWFSDSFWILLTIISLTYLPLICRSSTTWCTFRMCALEASRKRQEKCCLGWGIWWGHTIYIYITKYYKMLYLIYIFIILLLLLLCILYIYTYKKTHLKGLASFCLATAGASVSWFAP